ncbi:MAG: hypothetical protein IPH54_11585 [Rhodoferax sp.]|nr:hypothetical protein [Rhodoferax sp.]
MPAAKILKFIEAHMTALTLARWLNGFDAATENNFRLFYRRCVKSKNFDTLRPWV